MSKFNKGQRVRYVPSHVNGDTTHEDCEDGVVSTPGKTDSFIKYDNKICVMMTGNESYTSKLTANEDLVLI